MMKWKRMDDNAVVGILLLVLVIALLVIIVPIVVIAIYIGPLMALMWVMGAMVVGVVPRQYKLICIILLFGFTVALYLLGYR